MTNILQFLAEILLVYFAQSLLYVYGIYLLSEYRVQWKPFLFCAMASMLFTYFARTLLSFGNHTLFSLLLLMILLIAVAKIPAQKVVKNVLLIAIFTFLFEGVVCLVLELIFGKAQFDIMMEKSFVRTMFGIPSNVMLLVTLIGIRRFQKRKRTV